MKRSFKIGAAIAGSLAVSVGVSYLAYKIAKEIEAIPDETGDYKEKAKKWFSKKCDLFKEMIDKKNEQIAQIMANLKQDIIKETSEERRKELIENATIKINELKKDIKEIMETRTKELSEIAQKLSKSDIFTELVGTVISAKDSVAAHFSSDKDKFANLEADITYYEE